MLKRQITTGEIIQYVAYPDYLLITTETTHGKQKYVTTLRAGLTNMHFYEGDILSWSSIYDGTGSSMMWLVSKEREMPVKLYLYRWKASRLSSYERTRSDLWRVDGLEDPRSSSWFQARSSEVQQLNRTSSRTWCGLIRRI